MDEPKPKQNSSPETELQDDDYYWNEDGLMVLTEKFHLKKGYCCENRCKHCPYGNAPPKT